MERYREEVVAVEMGEGRQGGRHPSCGRRRREGGQGRQAPARMEDPRRHWQAMAVVRSSANAVRLGNQTCFDE